MVSVNSHAATDCEKLEKSLQREQFVITEREKELTHKVESEKESFSEEEMDRLIARHHASIKRFNLKLESFEDACRAYLASKPKDDRGKQASRITRVENDTGQPTTKAVEIETKEEATAEEAVTESETPAQPTKPQPAESQSTEPQSIATEPATTEAAESKQPKAVDKPAAKPRRAVRVRKAGGTMPAEEVAASDALIATLKGRYIQVGAFKEARMAKRMIRLLERNGYKYIKITRPYVYAIWVGPYETYKEAKAAKEKLLNVNKLDGYIIRFK